MQVLTMPSDHPESHGPDYGHNTWMGMGYSQSGQHHSMSPMPDYHAFDFHQTPAPLEPTYSMPRPPPYTGAGQHLPPPLIMPNNGLWPSMIASQNQPSYPTPILPAAPIHTPISAGTGSDVTPTSAKAISSRRKLTDEERRQMCIEAEQNPSMKQTQIGAKFNVERSTVSKILRQKEKYMNPPPKEEVTSPGKKSKAKLPDFEKTLTNWVKNQQRKGLSVSDDELRKQARVFSFSRSDQALVSSPSWLEMFKHKNSLTSESGNNSSTSLGDSTVASHSQAMHESPLSSGGLVSPPMSALERGDGIGDTRNDDFFDFESKGHYMGSPAINDMMNNDLNASILSPISPELAEDEGSHVNNFSLTTAFSSAVNSNRQRSQTFPHLPETNVNPRLASSGSNAPLPVRSMTTTANTRSTSIDPRQMMKRHKSVPDIHDADSVKFSSMQPPPLPKSADMSPVSSSGSPVEDDNIRALHAIKRLLQEHPGVADPDDYLAIGKLMEKLKLLKGPSTTSVLPGGMHPVDMLDSPRVSKKRTIMGIST